MPKKADQDNSNQTDQPLATGLPRPDLRGAGVLQDDREAFRWFSAAARNYAYLALAELYADGRGTDRDLIEALAHSEIAVLSENCIWPRFAS